jgi:exopolysaccharide biosynthesis polyprenyl glycosylphosphotransferase
MTPFAEFTAPPLDAPAFARRSSRPESDPIPLERFILLADVATLTGSLIGVLVQANMQDMPLGIAGFLSMRVTLKNLLLMSLLLVAWAVIFRSLGLYHRPHLRTWLAEATRLVAACSLATALACVFPLTSVSGSFNAVDLGRFWLVAVTSILAVRAARRTVIRGATVVPRRVVIVGAGPRGRTTCESLQRDRRYEIVGVVDSLDASWVLDGPRIGGIEDLEAFLMRQAVDEVFITLPVCSRYREIQASIRICERAGVPVKYRADIFDTSIAWPEYERSPVVTMHVAPHDSRLLLKRAIDLCGAVAALACAAPLLVLIAAAIKVTSRGPVLFRQERFGRNKRIFRMLKFRTMVADAARLQQSLEARNEMDGPVFKIRDDPRITRIGRLLRKTSLDELPQLLHVLTGEMSLVGPRPLPLRDVGRFTRASDMRRFSVRPGLTCLWQISGRNRIGFEEWMRLDLVYIDRWSLGLDFYILARTIPAVIRGAGAH